MAEQGSYIVVDDETLVANIYDELTEAHPIDCGCAWCLQEAGYPLGEGTHGICDYHAEDQYQRYRASRQVA